MASYEHQRKEMSWNPRAVSSLSFSLNVLFPLYVQPVIDGLVSRNEANEIQSATWHAHTSKTAEKQMSKIALSINSVASLDPN